MPLMSSCSQPHLGVIRFQEVTAVVAFSQLSSHGLQACAISSIDMDHEKFLGPTREDIASHKAYY